jgi:hypothetical protein
MNKDKRREASPDRKSERDKSEKSKRKEKPSEIGEWKKKIEGYEKMVAFFFLCFTFFSCFFHIKSVPAQMRARMNYKLSKLSMIC